MNPSAERRAQRAERIALCALRSALCAALLGCSVDAPLAPPVQPGLVVFSILDPSSGDEVVLLMQSRPSVPDTTPRPLDTNDPIVSAGEIPVSGARVVIYGPSNDSVVAVEDRVRRTDKLGAGVYRFGNTSATDGMPTYRIQPGLRYRLRVTSSVGDADGSTIVPFADRVLAGATRNINFARDTVLVPAGTVNAAGFVYSLRGTSTNTIEGDMQYRRMLERRLVLPSGGDDWAFAYARERFRTGTRHTLTVTAADSNYFAYYGVQFDPFADRTGRTNLKGAAGVFGSVYVFYTQPITVTGP